MFRKLVQYRLRTLLILIAVVCVALAGVWWVEVRPRKLEQQQMLAGRKHIHQRDRVYLDFVFDQSVKDHLVTVLGDSRLTHWDVARWIVCPDRQTMVSHGADQTFLVWNREDGSIRQGFYDVLASAYASQSKQFFLVRADGELQTWSLNGELREDRKANLPPLKIETLSCSPNGRFLVYDQKTPNGPQTTVWDREVSSAAFRVQGRFRRVVFSPDSQRLLLIESNNIHQYQAASGKRLSTVTTAKSKDGETAVVWDAVFTENGEHLYVSDANGHIFVYDWDKKQVLRDLGDVSGTVSHLAVFDGEERIYALSDQLRNYVWPGRWRTVVPRRQHFSALYAGPQGVVTCILGGRLIEPHGNGTRRLKGGLRVDATCFAFSPQGDRIALAGRDGQIVIRETARWERVQSWRAHQGWIRRLLWSPRDDHLVSFANGMTVVWNSRTGDEIHSATDSRASRDRLGVYDRHGERLAYYGGDGDTEITVLSAESFQVTDEIPRKSFSKRGNFLFSGDGRRMYVGSGKPMIHVWDLQSNRVAGRFGPTTYADVKLALSQDEKVIFAGDTRRVFAFDTVAGKQLWTTRAHDRQLFDISVHPTLSRLATSGGDGTVRLLDATTGREIQRLRLGPGRGDILQVDFSPDGQLLAAAMSNGAVVVLRSTWE